MTRPSRLTSHLLTAPLLAVALSAGLVACGDDADDAAPSEASTSGLTVTDAWVREPAVGQTNAAGYATITNESGRSVTLIGATAPVTATFEIHETMMDDDGVMSMQEREDGFAIADGETFTLEPGGPHVMMLGVEPAEFGGDIALTFVFDGAEPVTAVAELRQLDAAPMDDMDDGEMDEMDGDEG